MPFNDRDKEHMRAALSLAREAASLGEVPVGAVVVAEGGKVLAKDFNRSITGLDPTAHAEMLCLRAAAAALGNYRLTGATLYVSLEPCPMCAGALVWARIKRVVFGASDPKAGALGSRMDLSRQEGLNHHPMVEGGLLADESAQILQEFFRARRK
jgi:tRNA(adenine34) deaminase